MPMKPFFATLSLVIFAMLGPGSLLQAQEGRTYPLGLSLDLSGPESEVGNAYAKGVEDYFNYANERGMLNRDKIQCTIRDDKNHPPTVQKHFKEYLDKNILLYLNYSAISGALVPEVEREGLPMISASNPLDTPSNNIFSPGASHAQHLLALAEFVAKHHRGRRARIALFVNPTALGKLPVERLKKAVRSGLDAEVLEIVEDRDDLDRESALKRMVGKGIQYIICQTTHFPVAELLKASARMGLTAKKFGQPNRLTFLGGHGAGGKELIALAGAAAEGYIWSSSLNSTSIPGRAAEKQLALAKRYGRSGAIAHSHHYAAGIMAAQVALEAIRRAKLKGVEIDRQTLLRELNGMNGKNAFRPFTTMGPVTYSPTDRSGVDMIQLYTVKNGDLQKTGAPIRSIFMDSIN